MNLISHFWKQSWLLLIIKILKWGKFFPIKLLESNRGFVSANKELSKDVSCWVGFIRRIFYSHAIAQVLNIFCHRRKTQEFLENIHYFQKSKKWDKQKGNKNVSKIPHSLSIFLSLIYSSQLTSTVEMRENLKENRSARTPKHVIESREENKLKLVRNLLMFHHGSMENSLHCLWPHYCKPVIVSHIIFTKVAITLRIYVTLRVIRQRWMPLPIKYLKITENTDSLVWLLREEKNTAWA